MIFKTQTIYITRCGKAVYCFFTTCICLSHSWKDVCWNQG